MAKNRNKKKINGGESMDTSENVVSVLPQAMDTSEYGASKAATGGLNRKIKGRPMKRTKNVRKMKAAARAVAQSEKLIEKVTKNESKSARTQSAKTLYE